MCPLSGSESLLMVLPVERLLLPVRRISATPNRSSQHWRVRILKYIIANIYQSLHAAVTAGVGDGGRGWTQDLFINTYMWQSDTGGLCIVNETCGLTEKKLCIPHFYCWYLNTLVTWYGSYVHTHEGLLPVQRPLAVHVRVELPPVNV